MFLVLSYLLGFCFGPLVIFFLILKIGTKNRLYTIDFERLFRKKSLIFSALAILVCIFIWIAFETFQTQKKNYSDVASMAFHWIIFLNLLLAGFVWPAVRYARKLSTKDFVSKSIVALPIFTAIIGYIPLAAVCFVKFIGSGLG